MSDRSYGAARLAALLDGTSPPGAVHYTAVQPAAEVLAAAGRCGWRADLLDLRGTTDKAAFMDRCSRDLALPEWFGRNWDALHDCLSDPEWMGPRRRLVLACGWQDYALAEPGEWAAVEQVLGDAAEEWRPTPTPLLVLLEEEPLTDPARPTRGTSG